MGKRTLNRLSARSVASAISPGRFSDGGGLHLVVTANGSRKWVFRFAAQGRQRDMGLGPAAEISLGQARDAAAAARACVRDGLDPIEERQRRRAADVTIPTFGETADQLIDGIEGGFRNEKHRAQWRMTLREYAKPLRPMPVDQVATADVLAVLQPIWQAKPETASRLRGRIERVLDAARARGLRQADNPARWRGHLDALLPKPRKLTRGHHAALAFDDVPALVERLREAEGMPARALEFILLTAGRTTEVLGAEWPEISFDTGVWTVPAGRMKAGLEHRVPLCARAIDLLKALRQTGHLIFPGAVRGKPLSGTALTKTLRQLGCNTTVHGFRSSFRDWAGERTHFPREVAEAALAHVVGDETERAYRRGDALDKRRALMDAWATFCEPKASNVIALPARA